jgi:membrane peptidoglycan carboxypeptidase
VTYMLKALLSNGSVNTFQHATMAAVFSVEECYSSLLGSTKILATEGGVFYVSAPHNSKSVFYVVRAASI